MLECVADGKSGKPPNGGWTPDTADPATRIFGSIGLDTGENVRLWKYPPASVNPCGEGAATRGTGPSI